MNTFTRIALATAVIALAAQPVAAQRGKSKLANICRLKGQEENVLRGIGLVMGLNGTGEANDPATMRALSRALELMGNPVSMSGRFDDEAQRALRNVKNVSLVAVTATVPATGARSGDRLDCTVSAMNGKSLEGGRLIAAALQGPNTQDGAVYGLCEGAIQLPEATTPTVGKVHRGCQMTRDIYTPYVSDDGWVTFVLDTHHANFNVAQVVAEELTKKYADRFAPPGSKLDGDQIRDLYVHPIDAVNIRVKVPSRYEKDPVTFVAEMFDTEIYGVEPEARVVCNTKTGSVVISGEVEIGDVAFTHRNLMVEAGAAAGFEALNTSPSTRPRLDDLVKALANLRVPSEDVIEIIQSIDRAGKLHAKLIIL